MCEHPEFVDFAGDFERFVMNRVASTEQNMLAIPEIKDISQEISGIYDDLCKDLSPELQEKLRDYEAAVNNESAERDILIYRAGFRDGLKLAALIRGEEQA